MASADHHSSSSLLAEKGEFAAARANPFLEDMCRTPWQVEHTVESLQADLLEEILDTLEGQRGAPLMLLTAPRAGYGKTHLLGRIVKEVDKHAVIVPISFRSRDALSWATVSWRGIDSLLESELATPGWSRLREASAQVVMLLVRQLIEQGKLSCTNPSQALDVLKGSARAIFDRQGQARRIGEWLAAHREGLSHSLSAIAAQQLPQGVERLQDWMTALLRQALEGELAGVAEMQDLCSADPNASAPAWLSLLGLWKPVVILVDHLDGFYQNPDAGVKIATLMINLVDNHKMHVVLSLNQDIWQATFGDHLPGAIEDRLTANQVLLRGLNEKDATALLRLRLEGTGLRTMEKQDFEKFIHVQDYFHGRSVGSVSARTFLRHCARQWEVYHQAPATRFAITTSPIPQGVPSKSQDPVLTTKAEEKSIPAHQPILFDQETAHAVKSMAGSLIQPATFRPQTDFLPVMPAAQQAMPEARSSPAPAAAQSPNLYPASALARPIGNSPALGSLDATPTADAFIKLRDMLSRLRQPSGGVTMASPLPATGPCVAVAAESNDTQGTTASSQVASVMPAADPLQSRFTTLRLQHQAEAVAQPLDYGRLAEVIRLAGRRFPLVRFSEHELPGLSGRHALYWSMQSIEVLFGIGSPADTTYWQTMSAFAAGRLAELSAQAENEQRPMTPFKMVGFKTERDQLAWQSILQTQFFPHGVREVTDIIHLDVDAATSIYAMQRLIKESELGVLKAEPAQIISTLAKELDFFWKRLTRWA